MIKKIQFAVLTGGNSSRFGEDKLNYILNGKTILQQTIEKINKWSDLPILIIGKNSACISNVEFHKDIDLGIGPLRGIYTALKYASAEYVFVLAGDMPYIQPELINFLISHIKYEKDVVIPINKGFYEPLFAIYKTSLIPHFEKFLKKGQYKISIALNDTDKLEISENHWKQYDKNGVSFHNINTKSDLFIKQKTEKTFL